MYPKVYRLGHHQGKERAFQEALRLRGWRESRYINSKSIAFGLYDGDWHIDDNVSPWFLYPHAARPMVQYDGCVEPRPDCRTMFVSAPGAVHLMDVIGYPCEVVKVGWALTQIKPYKTRETVKNIVFAPIHPNSNGYLNDIDKDLNQRTYARLAEYVKGTGTTLTVRFCRRIEDNGLAKAMNAEDENVVWYQASTDKDTSIDSINAADVVVAHQTFAYMAIALGVPTVMMGEDIPPRSGNTPAGFSYVKHWDAYKDYLAYPLDILQGETADVIRAAITSDEPIKNWRDLFIGDPFDGDYFVDCIEERL